MTNEEDNEEADTKGGWYGDVYNFMCIDVH